MSKLESQSRDSLRTTKAGWIHFGFIAVVLLVATVGWNSAMSGLGWWTRKEPVPWPKNVRVDKKTFQNLTLAKRFGPYKLAKDGEIKQRKDVLETLMIDTTLNTTRIKKREGNWYVTRIYEDTREPKNSPFRFWHLDVTYFTGGETTVPHVPNACAQAGGATLTGEKILHTPVPVAPEPWSEDTAFTALGFEKITRGSLFEFVQYYLFSINGHPETSRKRVRLRLANLSLRYVYFSKIQFFPNGNVMNTTETSEKAKDFLRHCLPAVLRELPSPPEIEKLYQKSSSEE